MFELLTTDEFAEWFAGLDDPAAEDVAATLEVIAQLGARAEAPGSSEWLLWYEHPGLSARGRLEALLAIPPGLARFAEGWGVFLGYVKRVTKHLESPAFVARLAGLEARHAAVVADAVERIRRLSTTRHLALSEFRRRRGALGRALRAEDAGSLERFTDLTEVREAYFAALAAAGFALNDVPPHSPALREISLRGRPPGLRLLYGVDAPNDRALVVLGEWLDRSFYGDSVRSAERAWQRFLGGRLEATQPAKSR